MIHQAALSSFIQKLAQTASNFSIKEMTQHSLFYLDKNIYCALAMYMQHNFTSARAWLYFDWVMH
jgi:hypothetical protein